jgi:hypothetical protein
MFYDARNNHSFCRWWRTHIYHYQSRSCVIVHAETSEHLESAADNERLWVLSLTLIEILLPSIPWHQFIQNEVKRIWKYGLPPDICVLRNCIMFIYKLVTLDQQEYYTCWSWKENGYDRSNQESQKVNRVRKRICPKEQEKENDNGKYLLVSLHRVCRHRE